MPSSDRLAPPSRRAASLSPAQDDPYRKRPRPDAFEQAEQLVETGSWEWNVATDRMLWSDNMFRLLGLEPGAVRPTADYVIGRTHPDDRGRVTAVVAAARLDGSSPDVIFRVIWPDGAIRVLHGASAIVAEQEGGRSRLVGSVQDITELTDSQRETAESLTLMETLQSTAPVGFGFVDREFRIVRINERLLEVVGSHDEDPVGKTIAELVPEVWDQVGVVYRDVLASGRSRSNVEIERKGTESQDRRSLLANYYPVRIGKEVIGVGVVVVDITEREEARDFRSAVMDTIVEGLYVLDDEGRLTFMNAAASRLLGWTETELRGRSMHEAIHFQHADGTPHLERDCELLKVRTEGRAVRMSHEAFTRKDGTICPVAYSAAPLMAGARVGGVVVVFRDTRFENAEEDRARRELDGLVWVGRIRDALDEDRLVLYSQPIVPLAGGLPRQELLLRMAGAGGEIFPPSVFLPVAEKYGLIGEIDRWVIAEAVRLAAAGQRVEANLSAESIGNLDMLALIEKEIRSSGADPANVVFEITETALMENLYAGEAFTRGVSRLGCQVALDDFGTGFGGFTYLKKLPIDYLKIDTDFVLDLVTDHANQCLVRAIVGLAKDFGYQTIAEGVEDAETLALLVDYGVDFAQGFHLGLPRPPTP
jgi:PAS domain S-box-containing protein